MSHESSFHEGYQRALEEMSGLITEIDQSGSDIARLLHEVTRRIERARCACLSSLAAGATGDAGY